MREVCRHRKWTEPPSPPETTVTSTDCVILFHPHPITRVRPSHRQYRSPPCVFIFCCLCYCCGVWILISVIVVILLLLLYIDVIWGIRRDWFCCCLRNTGKNVFLNKGEEEGMLFFLSLRSFFFSYFFLFYIYVFLN